MKALRRRIISVTCFASIVAMAANYENPPGLNEFAFGSDENRVLGSSNIFDGDYNDAIGDGNDVVGSRNVVGWNLDLVGIVPTPATGWDGTFSDNNSFTGDYNNDWFRGAGSDNAVVGNSNEFSGDGNTITGNANGYWDQINGDGNTISGDQNGYNGGIQGDGNIIVGNKNGYTLGINGVGNLITGDGNDIVDGYVNTVDGDAVTGGLTVHSDRRLKREIQSVGNALDIVAQLHGKTYRWNAGNGRDERRHYGFVAQEVESVVPELVLQDATGTSSRPTTKASSPFS